MIGVSKGGDLACSMGTYIPEVKAVICINGLPVNTWSKLIMKNKVIPKLYFDMDKAEVLNSSFYQLLCKNSKVQILISDYQ